MVKCNLCNQETIHISRGHPYRNGDIEQEEFEWCQTCLHVVQGNSIFIKKQDREDAGKI